MVRKILSLAIWNFLWAFLQHLPPSFYPLVLVSHLTFIHPFLLQSWSFQWSCCLPFWPQVSNSQPFCFVPTYPQACLFEGLSFLPYYYLAIYFAALRSLSWAVLYQPLTLVLQLHCQPLASLFLQSFRQPSCLDQPLPALTSIPCPPLAFHLPVPIHLPRQQLPVLFLLAYLSTHHPSCLTPRRPYVQGAALLPPTFSPLPSSFPPPLYPGPPSPWPPSLSALPLPASSLPLSAWSPLWPSQQPLQPLAFSLLRALPSLFTASVSAPLFGAP